MPAPGFTRYPMWRRWFGRRSERAAAGFLRKAGYRILAANLDDRAGEIDLLALDGRVLVFVEVRSSESAKLTDTAATIDLAKQRRLTAAAVRFLARRGLLNHPARFDVLAVEWPPGGRPEYLHLRDAFPAVGKFQMYN